MAVDKDKLKELVEKTRKVVKEAAKAKVEIEQAQEVELPPAPK